jgi:hypothetical protein
VVAIFKMATMSTSKPIQIFKPGKFTAMNGMTLNFSEADLKASAAAYDPAKYEAPIVIGHPKHDDPAYGWVKSLNYAEGLDAEPHQVNADFAEMVDRGAFKKVSASFYLPDSPQNPVPGVYYLRHVGFLGAQPPAVKGLRSPEFAEKEEGVIEFGDFDDVVNASLWRRLRDWLIGEKGLDVADNIIPDYAVGTLETAAQQETDEGAPTAGPSFSETSPQGEEMSAEDKARLAALEQENAEIKKQNASFAEAQAKAARDKRHAEFAELADGLVKAGKLLPAHKEVAVATLDFMAAQEKTIEFGEGDAKKPLLDAFKTFLQSMPKQVEFSEVGHGKDAVGDAASKFVAPRGYAVDQDRLAVHQKALEYAEKKGCDYVTAVSAVSAA